MKVKYKAAFVTIVPSPYQRDMFRALAEREEIDLSVYYMEAASPDSPWPEAPLRPFEQIMPGFWASFGGARAHVNWPLPDLSSADFVVLNSFTSLTAQWLMRRQLRDKRWLFWGEILRKQPHGWREIAQTKLLAPLARASGIVGIGRQAEADYNRRYPAIPHFCIPYHCDLTGFLSSLRRTQQGGPLRFFFCGQMIRRKGVDLLLAAFDRLVANGLDVELLLVGREAELPEFMATLSPESRARVRYEGFQAPERLPEYFSQADVFILPSRHDGWGVVVNQALGAGLPVITSDAVGAGLDLVESGVNGLHCRAGDGDSLRQAMETVARNRDLARRWGEVSRQKAWFLTPEAGAKKWVQVFGTLS
jgi:glycosyltransferase involved in cell wall biosynthesis